MLNRKLTRLSREPTSIPTATKLFPKKFYLRYSNILNFKIRPKMRSQIDLSGA